MAFSTTGCVLDPFRSPLNATTIKTLIYTQTWLRPSKIGSKSQAEVGEMVEVETGAEVPFLFPDFDFVILILHHFSLV